MASNAVKKLLDEIRMQSKFDDDYLDLLSEANDLNKDGKTTASDILKLIKKRYAESKENNA